MAEQESEMPPWYKFVTAVLACLVDGEVHRARDIHLAAVDAMGLSEELRAERIASGPYRAQDRAMWATIHCFHAGLIERVSRGHYRITAKGRSWWQDNPQGFASPKEADIYFKPYWETQKTSESNLDSPSEPPANLTPRELIAQGVEEIQNDVAHTLLQRLRESDPDFFEEAVVKILLSMGYGGAEKRGQRIGGTGDGGVDGVIDQDALGLDQIYVQAKRYKEGNSVGREAIQAFIGALHGRGASRGVFITTSAFTPNAREYADQIPTRIVLIDGKRLTALMIKYKVGVQVKSTYEVVEIDEDFFE